VPIDLCLPLAPSFDSVGYFTRDGDTFERVGAVLLGADDQALPDRPRLLLASGAFARLNRDVREVLAVLLQTFEAQLGQATLVEPAPEGIETLYWAFRRLQGWEAWEADGALIEHYGLQLGPGVAERFAYAAALTEAEVEKARPVREAARHRLRGLLAPDAVLLLPTMPDVAPLLSDSEEALDSYRNQALNLLCLSGLSGLPQATLPLAMRHGAPLGISLMGPAGSDLSLVRLAARLASALR
jgi:amidase